MKLIIDIPEYAYNDMIKLVKVDGDIDRLVDVAIANGTPLEKHDEEVIKETVASVWGKPPYTEVLDEIKAEIERYQADCNLSCSDDANCRICDKITFDTIYRIIDKYRKGKANADGD